MANSSAPGASSEGYGGLDSPGRRRYTSAFLATRPQDSARLSEEGFAPMRSGFSLPESFPPDEVINYSERVSPGNDGEQREFLRFEPSSAAPPPPIRPENIGNIFKIVLVILFIFLISVCCKIVLLNLVISLYLFN